eukprot:NODE_12305_length_1233_cov_3.825497.p1 GENE.NODE_12305_length_1233_cov_3.825497~~NODE_12305_length_1233_cov_3.825497.p1  ORF type:complete len:344 (+),score=66.89 NODE_12305_length_1233_cov_3.825497:73-1032(+)
MAPWAWAALAGHLVIQIGFNAMHDGSHFALARGPALNMRVSRAWNAWALWNHYMWMEHHVNQHHCHTGDPARDPDLKNMRPFVPKRRDARWYRISGLIGLSRDVAVLFFYWVFPGQYFGQAVVYWVQWFRRGIAWKMQYPALAPRGANDDTRLWEYVLMAASLAMHIFWWQSPAASIAYIIAANASYFYCIIPDHDLFTTVVLNNAQNHSVDANDNSGKIDWGEAQVRESANFLNGSCLDIFCYLFGGINFQIEHHLFPSISHMHYPAIAPIVKRTCMEFDIPYYNCPSLVQATREFLRTVDWALQGATQRNFRRQQRG